MSALIDHARRHACQWAKDPTPGDTNWGMHLSDPPPHNRLLGPVFPRGDACGLLQVDDKTILEWGDTQRADMTFSVTKTYLALTAGVAHDRGLLADPSRAVADTLPGAAQIGFDDPHNRQVTWAQMLQFTSEWRGECWGVPDWVDHHRRVGFQPDAPPGTPPKGTPRTLQTPGTFWEYNDVRINQFSLALMHLLGQPLPQVFNDAIAKPLGLSDTWRWHGYDNSHVTLNDTSMQSVPGGGHWGGGMQISAQDQLKIGRLLLNKGSHNGRQLVSTDWINAMLTPCDIAPYYGYFTWLNRGDNAVPNASADSFFCLGIGGQTIWHEPAADLVAVFRWTDQRELNTLCALVLDEVNRSG